MHDDAWDGILEGFVEFAETSDDEIDEIVDVGICFLFVIDGFVVFIGMFFSDTEEVVDWVVHDFEHLFGDELFLVRRRNTSP